MKIPHFVGVFFKLLNLSNFYIKLFIQLQPLLKNLASLTPNPIFLFFSGMGLTIGPILGIMYIHRSKSDGTN